MIVLKQFDLKNSKKRRSLMFLLLLFSFSSALSQFIFPSKEQIALRIIKNKGFLIQKEDTLVSLSDKIIYNSYQWIHIQQDGCFETAYGVYTNLFYPQDGMHMPLQDYPYVALKTRPINLDSISKGYDLFVGEGNLFFDLDNENKELNLLGIKALSPYQTLYLKRPEHLQLPKSFLIQIQVDYRLPQNFEIIVPDGLDMEMPYGLMNFKFYIIPNGRTYSVLLNFELNQDVFPLTAEPMIASFFEKVQDKLKTKIILKKIE